MASLFQMLQPKNCQVYEVRNIVVKMTNKVLFLRTGSGIHAGKHLILPHIPWDPSDDEFPTLGVDRTQLPVLNLLRVHKNGAEAIFQ